jgi:hypothetical protein
MSEKCQEWLNSERTFKNLQAGIYPLRSAVMDLVIYKILDKVLYKILDNILDNVYN